MPVGRVNADAPACQTGAGWRLAGGLDHLSRVVFKLDQNGPVVKLTLIHYELDDKDIDFFMGISGGWPLVLSNLKSPL